MKSSSPLVSIVIPVYNGSNYLKDAIDSALAQTYTNIEVIVINDGSTDGGKTDKLAKSYGRRIRYYLKRNGGVATALNYGIGKMKGDWFSWLSHDDIYEPYKVEKQVECLAKHKSAKIIYSDYELVNQDALHLHNISVKPNQTNNMQLRLIDSYPLNGCAMLIHKKCFADIGYFDVNLPTTQDYDLWYRFASKYEFHYLPVSVLQSRQHEGQGSHLNNHKREVDRLYDKFIRDLPISTAIQEKGSNLGNWLLEVARVYKNRGYQLSPRTVLEKYKLVIPDRGINYWFTVVYCLLPTNFVIQLADLEHKTLRTMYSISGYIKKWLRKII